MTAKPKADAAAVLLEAFLNAGQALGLSRAELGQVIGKDRSALSRRGLRPGGKDAELALLLIRCYRALYVLVGGDTAQLQHWMHTPNRHTGGVPAEQVKTIQGLALVLSYLDAMRAKV